METGDYSENGEKAIREGERGEDRRTGVGTKRGDGRRDGQTNDRNTQETEGTGGGREARTEGQG